MGITAQAEQVARDRWALEVDGRTLRLSNLDRILYSATNFTKGDLIDFYSDVAPVLVSHLEGRPVTLRRFPGGAEESGFWQKRCPDHRPEWIETAAVQRHSKDEAIDFCLMNDRASVIWAANLAAIELHTSLARAGDMTRPTAVVFDLDPGEPADLVDSAKVALMIRGLFGELGLTSLVKTSGSKGLQLYVPLNGDSTYEQTRPFAQDVARALESELPDRITSKMKRDLRPGKVFVDWSQNSEHKTTVCAYSMRARPEPSVSAPVSWEEVEEASGSGDPSVLRFGPQDILDRVERHGDLLSDVLGVEQSLPDFRRTS